MSKKINKEKLNKVNGGFSFVDLTDEMVCPKCGQTIKICDIKHIDGKDICPKCNQNINDEDSYKAVFT